MRIKGSELKKIIKEEISRHFMNEEDEETVYDFSDKPETVTAKTAMHGSADFENKKKALLAKLAKRGIKLDTSAIEAILAAD